MLKSGNFCHVIPFFWNVPLVARFGVGVRLCQTRAKQRKHWSGNCFLNWVTAESRMWQGVQCTIWRWKEKRQPNPPWENILKESVKSCKQTVFLLFCQGNVLYCSGNAECLRMSFFFSWLYPFLTSCPTPACPWCVCVCMCVFMLHPLCPNCCSMILATGISQTWHHKPRPSMMQCFGDSGHCD